MVEAVVVKSTADYIEFGCGAAAAVLFLMGYGIWMKRSGPIEYRSDRFINWTKAQRAEGRELNRKRAEAKKLQGEALLEKIAQSRDEYDAQHESDSH